MLSARGPLDERDISRLASAVNNKIYFILFLARLLETHFLKQPLSLVEKDKKI